MYEKYELKCHPNHFGPSQMSIRNVNYQKFGYAKNEKFVLGKFMHPQLVWSKSSQNRLSSRLAHSYKRHNTIFLWHALKLGGLLDQAKILNWNSGSLLDLVHA